MSQFLFLGNCMCGLTRAVHEITAISYSHFCKNIKKNPKPLYPHLYIWIIYHLLHHGNSSKLNCPHFCSEDLLLWIFCQHPAELHLGVTVELCVILPLVSQHCRVLSCLLSLCSFQSCNHILLIFSCVCLELSFWSRMQAPSLFLQIPCWNISSDNYFYPLFIISDLSWTVASCLVLFLSHIIL